MQDLKVRKSEIRRETLALRNGLSAKERAEKSTAIAKLLLGFANFLEAKTVLLYMSTKSEVATETIVRRALEYQKAVALPLVDTKTRQIVTLKVDDLEQDLRPGYGGILEPILQRCRVVPVEYIDLAIIPGVAFDERGGRIGHGTGFYDQLIPRLNATTRKVGLAFERQIVPQIPMEPHDRYIDIIITEERIIYKI